MTALRRTMSPSIARMPPVLGQADASAPERDAFPLEPDPLGQHAAHPRAGTDAAAGVDHPMPGEIRRTTPQGPADRPSRPGPAQARRDLAVGDDAAAGDASHQAPHRLDEPQTGRLLTPSSHSRAYSPPRRNSSARSEERV